MRRLDNPGDVLITEASHHWADDTLVVKRTQDVEPILEANKRRFDPDNKRYAGETFHQVASIPNIVVEQWMSEGINVFDRNHWPAIQRKLNDPAYRYLRTKPGRI